jgi:hypothetical protein
MGGNKLKGAKGGVFIVSKSSMDKYEVFFFSTSCHRIFGMRS